jgi:two-component system LytT family sensor kinase
MTHPSTWPRWKKLLLAFGFWTVVGLVFSTQHLIYVRYLGEEATWLEGMRAAMPRWYAWALLTPLVMRIHRRFPARWTLPEHLLAHLVLGLLVALLVMGAVFTFHWSLGGPFVERPVPAYLTHVYWDFLIYGLITGITSAWRYAAEIQRRELQAAQLEVKAAQLEQGLTEARLHALRSQLNPHFLFNALNAISAYTEQEPRTARRMMAQLGELLRFSLDHASHQQIRLEAELSFLESYLEIERMRFEGRLTVSVEVDPRLRGALVPSFLLQPLVENAIRHGLSKRRKGGRVDVTAHRAGSTLVVRVEDDGVGLPEGWRLDRSSGTGLRNLAGRLAELYGDRHTFRIEGSPGGGVLVEVVLPYVEGVPGGRGVRSIEEAVSR